MNLIFTKIHNGMFIPGDKATEEYTSKLKTGETIHADFKRMRNYKWHKKFFAMLQLAYEYWNPGEIDSKYGVPEKNFERFRKDAIILAGYYHTEIRLDGSVRVEPDSISFAKMDNETFSALYNNVLNVLLQRIPVLAEMGKEQIDKITNQLLDFG